MSAVFVPMFDPPRNGKHSARVGWITDANGCDIWQGSRSGDGYGRVHYGTRMQSVYRLRYEREIGPIPPGAELDHFVCDNGDGGCCNPFHCRPATHRENMLRSARAKTHCPKGHPLSGENLVRSKLARGWRECQICKTDHNRARPSKAAA